MFIAIFNVQFSITCLCSLAHWGFKAGICLSVPIWCWKGQATCKLYDIYPRTAIKHGRKMHTAVGFKDLLSYKPALHNHLSYARSLCTGHEGMWILHSLVQKFMKLVWQIPKIYQATFSFATPQQSTNGLNGLLRWQGWVISDHASSAIQSENYLASLASLFISSDLGELFDINTSLPR